MNLLQKEVRKEGGIAGGLISWGKGIEIKREGIRQHSFE